MEAIKEFIFSLMIVSVSCAAINMLAPENSTVSKYLHFLVALIVTVVLLSPFQNALDIIPEIIGDDLKLEVNNGEIKLQTYAELVIKETCDNIAIDISNMLEARFSVKPEKVDILCNAENIENVIIEEVTVTYDRYNKLLFSDTIKYIEEIMGCNCEVVAADENSK